MSTVSQTWNINAVGSLVPTTESAWYAVHTYPRHERAVANRMQRQALTTFFPTVTEVHRWSDRRKTVELPLFSCYAFVHIAPTNEQRVRVLRTDGVIGLVGSSRIGTPIPDEQIEAVRTLLLQDIACTAHAFLRTGQRVRVRGGALEGIEGVFVSQNGDQSLVISVDAIQRSLSIRIDGYDIEPI